MDALHRNETRDALAKIVRLNDDAVLQWALGSNEPPERVVSGLVEALEQVHTLSQILLQDRPPRKEESAGVTPFAVLPLSVDVDPGVVTVCLNRAFLFKCTKSGDVLEDISIAAAVVFYNTALFYHQQVETNHGSDDSGIISRYYEIANSIVTEIVERTNTPMWNFQAALLYNLADCYRLVTVTLNSVKYFGRLEEILSNINDPEDRAFYQRAIAMARLQLRLCCSAAVA